MSFEDLKKRVISKHQPALDVQMVDTTNVKLYSQFAPGEDDLAMPKENDRLCFFGRYDEKADCVVDLRTGMKHKALYEIPMINDGHHIKKAGVDFESVGLYLEKDKAGNHIVTPSDCAVTDRLCQKKMKASSDMVEVVNALRKSTPVSKETLLNIEKEFNDYIHADIRHRNKTNNASKFYDECYM